MKIDVRISRLFLGEKGSGNMKAYANANIEDAFAIHGIKVMDGEKGLFVAMPSEKGSDGKYHEIFHPITAEARTELSVAVLSAYKQELSQRLAEIEAQIDGAEGTGLQNGYGESEAGEELSEDAAGPSFCM